MPKKVMFPHPDLQDEKFSVDPPKSVSPPPPPGPIVEKNAVTLTSDEVEILRTLLDRDRTSKLVHGGLKSLLGLSDREAETLLNFLRRI